MKDLIEFIKTTLIGGLLIILPLVVLVILLKRAVAAVDRLLAPAIAHLPPGLPFPDLMALTIELFVITLACFIAGLVVKTPIGRRAGHAIETRLFEKVPGYKLMRSLIRRAAGDEEEIRYKVALVEIEEGLVPAFIIEQHQDGRYTVFVPAVPPTSGAVYIFTPDKVHLVDVPFATALRCLTKFGQGSETLVQAMRRS